MEPASQNTWSRSLRERDVFEVGDLVVAYTGPEPDIRKNFFDHHGFGIVMEITELVGGTYKYTVKFTKSKMAMDFFKDGLMKHE